MAKGIHTEESFEALIEAHLLGHGWETAAPADYDRDRALLPAVVVDFVQATQPKAWAKLQDIHGAKLETLLLAELVKVLDRRGPLPTLREGFKFYGVKLELAYFQPGHGHNDAVWERYAQNRLSVVRQLRYDPKNENALDLALFLNGLPIATAELKNPMTGQTVAHAKAQYQNDRDPNAPLFRWKKRALVHFAVDPDEVWMTTRLRGKSTFFLPFNRGKDLGAGNPAVPGKHRTCYLWEQVWQRDSLLDIVGRFLHLQKKEKSDPNTGKVSVSETMIFPRYHQLDCVRQLVAVAREQGAGTNYLVQHSAGSGKSNTIAWLAHRLTSLHDEKDRKVYDSVIVLTDRLVLDQQLQNTIYQFDHKTGVVERIDKHSDQLAKALRSGAPIIISTIHKFGFIQDQVKNLPDRRYAILVDEAHSSQSGEMAVTVKELLADSSVADKVAAEVDDLAAPDQLALRAALVRGPQANLSFFAFTATPKFKTLEMFGHEDEDGKPVPFHLYSMRQAIEEGFILDVLNGYITHKRFFALAKAVSEDPKVDKRKAATALARFVNLHPKNIEKKTKIIVEHFRACVQHLLGGRAKGMVVTGSRLEAVRYREAFDAYLEKQGYDDLRCLVAFSGEVTDDKVPGQTYTEPGMNGGIQEKELPTKFASDAYQLLIVANKYQTGFDQPLLTAMYVDKRLAGIQAVQTLSRLNRMAPGKERTFVLDFVNEREHILAAFQDYFETTTVSEPVDPQRLYELVDKLDEFRVLDPAEVDSFAKVFFQLPSGQRVTDHAQLNARLDPAVDRFKALGVEGEDRDEKQADFRAKLGAFGNLYGFLGQTIPFQDPDLEKRYAYGRMLLAKLPRPDTGGPLALGDDVALTSLIVKKEAEGRLRLKKGQGGELVGPTDTGTGTGKPPFEKLSTIIDVLNQRFGTNFDAQDLVDGVRTQLEADGAMQQAARANDKGNFAHVFTPALDDALADRHAGHAAFINHVFADRDFGSLFRELMLDRVYEELRATDATDDASAMPLTRVPPAELRPFENAVPVLDLKVAAGGFSPDQVVEGELGRYDWVALAGPTKPAHGLFVAQVLGESMNRRIPNGAWCLWKLTPQGAQPGRVVLAQHRDIQDPETQASFTVKRYRPEPAGAPQRVTLLPDSTDQNFAPLTFEGLPEGALRVVAELVEVLDERS